MCDILMQPNFIVVLLYFIVYSKNVQLHVEKYPSNNIHVGANFVILD